MDKDAPHQGMELMSTPIDQRDYLYRMFRFGVISKKECERASSATSHQARGWRI